MLSFDEDCLDETTQYGPQHSTPVKADASNCSHSGLTVNPKSNTTRCQRKPQERTDSQASQTFAAKQGQCAGQTNPDCPSRKQQSIHIAKHFFPADDVDISQIPPPNEGGERQGTVNSNQCEKCSCPKQYTTSSVSQHRQKTSSQDPKPLPNDKGITRSCNSCTIPVTEGCHDNQSYFIPQCGCRVVPSSTSSHYNRSKASSPSRRSCDLCCSNSVSLQNNLHNGLHHRPSEASLSAFTSECCSPRRNTSSHYSVQSFARSSASTRARGQAPHLNSMGSGHKLRSRSLPRSGYSGVNMCNHHTELGGPAISLADITKAPTIFLDNDIMSKQREEIQLLMEELAGRDQELNDMVTSHQRQVRVWETDRDRLEGLQARLNKYEEELSNKEHQLSQTLAEMGRVQEQKEIDLVELGKTRADMVKLADRISENSSYIHEIEVQNKSLNASVKDLLADKKHLEEKEHKLLRQLNEKTAECEEHQASIKQMRKSFDHLEHEVDAMDEKCRRKEQENETWREKFFIEKDEYEKLAADCDSKDLTMAKMTQQLQESLQQAVALQKALFTSCEREKCKEEVLHSLRKQHKRTMQELTNIRELYDLQHRDLSTPRRGVKEPDDPQKERSTRSVVSTCKDDGLDTASTHKLKRGEHSHSHSNDLSDSRTELPECKQDHLNICQSRLIDGSADTRRDRGDCLTSRRQQQKSSQLHGAGNNVDPHYPSTPGCIHQNQRVMEPSAPATRGTTVILSDTPHRPTSRPHSRCERSLAAQPPAQEHPEPRQQLCYVDPHHLQPQSCSRCQAQPQPCSNSIAQPQLQANAQAHPQICPNSPTHVQQDSCCQTQPQPGSGCHKQAQPASRPHTQESTPLPMLSQGSDNSHYSTASAVSNPSLTGIDHGKDKSRHNASRRNASSSKPRCEPRSVKAAESPERRHDVEKTSKALKVEENYDSRKATRANSSEPYPESRNVRAAKTPEPNVDSRYAMEARTHDPNYDVRTAREAKTPVQNCDSRYARDISILEQSYELRHARRAKTPEPNKDFRYSREAKTPEQICDSRYTIEVKTADPNCDFRTSRVTKTPEPNCDLRTSQEAKTPELCDLRRAKSTEPPFELRVKQYEETCQQEEDEKYQKKAALSTGSSPGKRSLTGSASPTRRIDKPVERRRDRVHSASSGKQTHTQVEDLSPLASPQGKRRGGWKQLDNDRDTRGSLLHEADESGASPVLRHHQKTGGSDKEKRKQAEGQATRSDDSLGSSVSKDAHNSLRDQPERRGSKLTEAPALCESPIKPMKQRAKEDWESAEKVHVTEDRQRKPISRQDSYVISEERPKAKRSDTFSDDVRCSNKTLPQTPEANLAKLTRDSVESIDKESEHNQHAIDKESEHNQHAASDEGTKSEVDEPTSTPALCTSASEMSNIPSPCKFDDELTPADSDGMCRELTRNLKKGRQSQSPKGSNGRGTFIKMSKFSAKDTSDDRDEEEDQTTPQANSRDVCEAESPVVEHRKTSSSREHKHSRSSAFQDDSDARDNLSAHDNSNVEDIPVKSKKQKERKQKETPEHKARGKVEDGQDEKQSSSRDEAERGNRTETGKRKKKHAPASTLDYEDEPPQKSKQRRQTSDDERCSDYDNGTKGRSGNNRQRNKHKSKCSPESEFVSGRQKWRDDLEMKKSPDFKRTWSEDFRSKTSPSDRHTWKDDIQAKSYHDVSHRWKEDDIQAKSYHDVSLRWKEDTHITGVKSSMDEDLFTRRKAFDEHPCESPRTFEDKRERVRQSLEMSSNKYMVDTVGLSTKKTTVSVNTSKNVTSSSYYSSNRFGSPDAGLGSSKYGSPDPALGSSKYGSHDTPLGSSKYGSHDTPLGSNKYSLHDPPLGSSKFGSPDPALGSSKYGSPDGPLGSSKYGSPDPALGSSKYGSPDLALGGSKYGSHDPIARSSRYGSPDPQPALDFTSSRHMSTGKHNSSLSNKASVGLSLAGVGISSMTRGSGAGGMSSNKTLGGSYTSANSGSHRHMPKSGLAGTQVPTGGSGLGTTTTTAAGNYSSNSRAYMPSGVGAYLARPLTSWYKGSSSRNFALNNNNEIDRGSVRDEDDDDDDVDVSKSSYTHTTTSRSSGTKCSSSSYTSKSSDIHLLNNNNNNSVGDGQCSNNSINLGDATDRDMRGDDVKCNNDGGNSNNNNYNLNASDVADVSLEQILFDCESDTPNTHSIDLSVEKQHSTAEKCEGQTRDQNSGVTGAQLTVQPRPSSEAVPVPESRCFTTRTQHSLYRQLAQVYFSETTRRYEWVVVPPHVSQRNPPESEGNVSELSTQAHDNLEFDDIGCGQNEGPEPNTVPHHGPASSLEGSGSRTSDDSCLALSSDDVGAVKNTHTEDKSVKMIRESCPTSSHSDSGLCCSSWCEGIHVFSSNARQKSSDVPLVSSVFQGPEECLLGLHRDLTRCAHGTLSHVCHECILLQRQAAVIGQSNVKNCHESNYITSKSRTNHTDAGGLVSVGSCVAAASTNTTVSAPCISAASRGNTVTTSSWSYVGSPVASFDNISTSNLSICSTPSTSPPAEVLESFLGVDPTQPETGQARKLQKQKSTRDGGKTSLQNPPLLDQHSPGLESIVKKLDFDDTTLEASIMGKEMEPKDCDLVKQLNFDDSDLDSVCIENSEVCRSGLVCESDSDKLPIRGKNAASTLSVCQREENPIGCDGAKDKHARGSNNACQNFHGNSEGEVIVQTSEGCDGVANVNGPESLSESFHDISTLLVESSVEVSQTTEGHTDFPVLAVNRDNVALGNRHTTEVSNGSTSEKVKNAFSSQGLKLQQCKDLQPINPANVSKNDRQQQQNDSTTKDKGHVDGHQAGKSKKDTSNPCKSERPAGPCLTVSLKHPETKPAVVTDGQGNEVPRQPVWSYEDSVEEVADHFDERLSNFLEEPELAGTTHKVLQASLPPVSPSTKLQQLLMESQHLIWALERTSAVPEVIRSGVTHF